MNADALIRKVFWVSESVLALMAMAALSDQLQAQRSACVWALGVSTFELVFNAPAIVLSRHLYLLTLRRLGLTSL